MKAIKAAVRRWLVAGLDLRWRPSNCGHTHGSGHQRARGTRSKPVAIARDRHGRLTCRRSSSCRHRRFTATTCHATSKDAFAATGTSCHCGDRNSASTKELWSADQGVAAGPDAGEQARSVCVCALLLSHIAHQIKLT